MAATLAHKTGHAVTHDATSMSRDIHELTMKSMASIVCPQFGRNPSLLDLAA